MFRKNTASQFIYFQLLSTTDGSPVIGATVTVRRCIDGTFAYGSGTVTEDSEAVGSPAVPAAQGFYKYAMSQADANGNNIGFRFAAPGAVSVEKTIVTTAADPTDVVRLGLTALPNAAAEAAGGLFTRGTGAGQINQDANGRIDANIEAVNNVAVTGTGAPGDEWGS